jgi:hypothetical protein
VPPDEISTLSMLLVLQSLRVDEWCRRWNDTTQLFLKNWAYTGLLEIDYPRGLTFVAFI